MLYMSFMLLLNFHTKMVVLECTSLVGLSLKPRLRVLKPQPDNPTSCKVKSTELFHFASLFR